MSCHWLSFDDDDVESPLPKSISKEKKFETESKRKRSKVNLEM